MASVLQTSLRWALPQLCPLGLGVGVVLCPSCYVAPDSAAEDSPVCFLEFLLLVGSSPFLKGCLRGNRVL